MGSVESSQPQPQKKVRLNSPLNSPKRKKVQRKSLEKIKPTEKAQVKPQQLNHNLVEKAKNKVNRAVHNSFKPTKDKKGINIKKHFGVWKYFINKQSDEAEAKQKFYISNDCRKIPEPLAYRVAKQDDNYVNALKSIQRVGLKTQDPERLEFWGIPDGICEQLYKHTGIKKLFPWQAECLSLSQKVHSCQSNLVYFAPTSGGKSIVSEILMLRAILGFKRRAIYVLPYVSIVSEKCQTLLRLAENINLKIIQLHSQSEATWTPDVDLTICTIEKANSLMNKLIEEQIYFDVSFFIIDEFHLIQDEQRGWMLETILSKLKTIEKIFDKPNAFQIVGMSATMSGLETLKAWLGETAVYECLHRPVPLTEYTLDTQSCTLFEEPPRPLLILNEVQEIFIEEEKRKAFNMKQLCSLKTHPKPTPLFPNDKEFFAAIVCAYLRKKKAVLIFVPTKTGCQKLASQLVKVLPMQYSEYKPGKAEDLKLEFSDLVSEITQIISQVTSAKQAKKVLSREDIYDRQLHIKRLRLIEELKQCPSGLCETLKTTVKFGIAYHHSGLTNDEKCIIEKGYRQGTLLVLVATSTLSTGINLPAKAVLFKTPFIAQQMMECAKYKQMSGRAGRTGFDPRGEVVMVVNNYDQMRHVRVQLLIPFKAKLSSALSGSRLVRSQLEMIASQAVGSLYQMQVFVSSTLQYQLAKLINCDLCSFNFDITQSLFDKTPSLEASEYFKSFLAAFDVKQFIDIEKIKTNYGCRNCLLVFTQQIIAYLQKKHFLIVENGKILPTPLGKAAFASQIPPEESAQIFQDLVVARQLECLVLETDLHLLYLVTPHFKGLREPNWEAYFKIYKRMTKCEQKIASIYKLDRHYIEWAREVKPSLPDFITDKGNTDKDAPPQELYCLAERLDDQTHTLIRHCKFYMALMANEVLKETPVRQICDDFNCNRGQIQTVQQQALNYAGMMSAFCERLCWTDYSILFIRITEKINWQVREELLDLMQLPSLRPERARTLYTNGVMTVDAVAQNCSVEQMVKMFAKTEGFVTHRQSNCEDLALKYEYLYSFSHKIMSEAKALMIKRKYEPETTGVMDQSTLLLGGDADFMIVSDYDSDSSSEDGDCYMTDPFGEKESEVPNDETANDGTIEIVGEISFEESQIELDLSDFQF